MERFIFSSLFGLLVAIAAAGCGDLFPQKEDSASISATSPTAPVAASAANSVVHIAAQSQEHVVMPRMEFRSGTVVTTELALAEELETVYHNGFRETNITFADPSSSGCSNGQCWWQLHQQIFDTDYSFEFVRSHYGFVSGCIKRDLMHTSIIFRKKGPTKPIIDIHVAHWRQDGKYCIGIYVSPLKWSKCPCFNDPSNWSGPKAVQAFGHEIKKVVQEALESSGTFMNQQAAAIAAAGLAPIIWWALPFPPPPL